jgi:hypothetical protein
MFYRHTFLLTTNRHVFSPERTPSPEVYELTNRWFFDSANIDVPNAVVTVDSEQDNLLAISPGPLSHQYVNETGDNNLGCEVGAEPSVGPGRVTTAQHDNNSASRPPGVTGYVCGPMLQVLLTCTHNKSEGTI